LKILGIDPGTVLFGYGLLDEGESALDWGVISCPRRQQLPYRLHHLYSRLLDLVDKLQPSEMAVEEPFVPGENRDLRTGIIVGQAQAVALMVSAARNIPIARYSPTKVKSAVAGHGGSSKSQVQEMVRLQLGLQSPPEPQDAADALAVALCHSRLRKLQKLLAEQPPSKGII